jgi:CheY-like chemotaxis protein
MVYGIMKNHHGFLDVESSVGKGTTFRLYLPAAVSGEKSAVIQADSGDRRAASAINQYATVLVVEDEQAMTRLLGDALLQAGYHVLVALDGAEAIELYRHHLNDIHVVVLDLGLPRVAGPEVIRIMKELNRQAKIIVTTGYLEPELKSELFAFGVKDYIQKPYSVDSVLEKLQSVMSAT